MNILLDECVPRKLSALLPGHDCQTVPKAGWAGIKNGQLLDLAEDRFEVFLTVDRNLSFQQSTVDRKIMVVVLKSTSNQLAALAPLAPMILDALKALQPGTVQIIE
ncbi:MAG TPA: DUF5615 family PIN-like protein [Fimbriimonadaceae bacterium]|jgi:hypothetical protein